MSCAGDCGACPTCGELRAGGRLSRGESAMSCDGRFTLAMQGDGNLVLYMGATPLWASGTDGTGGSSADMQGDGNFVLYDGAGVPLWASGTDGNPGAYLAIQNDGNLVVYATDGRALWSSGTCCH